VSAEPAALIAKMLARRGPGKTLCPSEVARALTEQGGDWRARMEEVHGVVDRLTSADAIVLSWKGKPLSCRDGPYRIGLPR
jgi:hypothetical protein